MSTTATNNQPELVRNEYANIAFDSKKLRKKLREFKAIFVPTMIGYNHVDGWSVGLEPDSMPVNYDDWVDDGAPIVITSTEYTSGDYPERTRLRLALNSADELAKAVQKAKDFYMELDKEVKEAFDYLEANKSKDED